MPFGLCNALATFQRLMDVVLSDLTFEVLLIKLDHIIVFSNDFGTHRERLELVFNRLRQHGLKLKQVLPPEGGSEVSWPCNIHSWHPVDPVKRRLWRRS